MKEPIKIKYCGCYGDFTGYGESNRNHIKALVEAGVNVTTEKVSYTPTHAESGENYELAHGLEGKNLDYDIKIVHTPSDNYIKLLEPTKYHIGHLFWETDGLSQSWVWNCNRVDEVWTGGHSHKEAFQRAGVKVPIYVFPQPVDTEVEPLPPFDIPGHTGYLFYSIFQWIERKNPRGLLEAYWREFDGEEKVTLLLKVYRFGFGQKEIQKIKDDIGKWKTEIEGVKQFPRVLLLTNLMNKNDMLKLHSTGDCFVSAHRGEGWGIPQGEAMTLGKPIISTNLGGIHEWLSHEKDSFLIKWSRIKVSNMEFAPWYDKSQSWAEPDINDLRKYMRHVFDNPDRGMAIGKQGQELCRNKFSYKTVGKAMAERLAEISTWINR